MLSERKHTILQSLIQEYVVSAHPVASSTLVRYYVPRLSPATVRNELSWLGDRGYVTQPHTSAGRMPTTAGYRTFVNSILLHPQQYRALVGRARIDTETSVTGRARVDVGDVETGDMERTRVGAESTGPGAVSVSQYAKSLSVLSSLASASDKLFMINEVLGSLAELNKSLVVFWAPQLSSTVIHRGLPLLLSQPEFTEVSAAMPIMQLLESHGDLMEIFEEVMDVGGLHIRIGSENRDAQLYEFSLVATRFNSANLKTTTGSSQGPLAAKRGHYGVVAVFGPTRMNYEWAISSISSFVQNLECLGYKQRD